MLACLLAHSLLYYCAAQQMLRPRFHGVWYGVGSRAACGGVVLVLVVVARCCGCISDFISTNTTIPVTGTSFQQHQISEQTCNLRFLWMRLASAFGVPIGIRIVF